MEKPAERIATFDIMKGIGIILVILGHSELVGISFVEDIDCFSLIFAFHIPLFFIISGFFFRPQPINKAIRKDTYRLLFPYFLTSLLCVSSFFLVKLFFYDLTYVPRFAIGFLSGYAPVLWFLFAMFFARTFYNAGVIYIEQKWGLFLFSVFVVIVSMIGYLMQDHFTIYLYNEPIVLFSLLPSLAALFFIHIGRLWKIFFPKFGFLSTSFAFLLYLSSAYCGGLSMFSGHYPNILINLLGAFGGTLIVYKISKLIECVAWLSSVLQRIGRASLLVLCVHCIDFVFGFRVRVSEPLISCLCMLSFPIIASIYLAKVSFIRKLFYL